MNVRDRQAAENLGLSLFGRDVLAVSQLPTPTPSASFVAAGADAFDAHGALGDVEEASRAYIETPAGGRVSDEMATLVDDGRVFVSLSRLSSMEVEVLTRWTGLIQQLRQLVE
jgi:hypothetical protein